jgi:hypothetical protein
MTKNYRLNSTNWLLNPWFDIFIITGFPVFLILIPLMYQCFVSVPGFKDLLYLIGNFPHVLSGLLIVYLLLNIDKKVVFSLIVIPAAILIIILITFTLGVFDFLHLPDIRFLIGRYHIFFQYYIILQVSKIINYDDLKIDKVIDTLTLLISAIYISLLFLFKLEWKVDTLTIYNLSIDTHQIKYILFLSLAIIIIFILRQFYLFTRYKKIYPFKILLILTVYAITYLPFLVLSEYDVEVHNETEIALHSFQYIAWVWLFLSNKFIIGKAAINNKLRNSHSFLTNPLAYLVFLAAITLVYNFTFSQKSLFQYYHETQSAFAFVHMYLDIMIWNLAGVYAIGKLRKESIESGG